MSNNDEKNGVKDSSKVAQPSEGAIILHSSPERRTGEGGLGKITQANIEAAKKR